MKDSYDVRMDYYFIPLFENMINALQFMYYINKVKGFYP